MVLTLPPSPPALNAPAIHLSGTPLSTTQIYDLARNAGFPPDMAVRMTAIALRESGGDPNAYNGAGADNSYGLTQINMYGNLGPARLQQLGLSDPSQLLDPATNMRAAYQLWAGSDANFKTLWTQDATQYLPQATEAALTSDGVTVDIPTDSLPSDATAGISGTALAVGALLLAGVLLTR